jgi:hypothetical protein
MTNEQILASFKALQSHGNLEPGQWSAWYAALAQPQPPGAGPQRVDEATYAAMSPAERLDYVRRFPQVLDDGRHK